MPTTDLENAVLQIQIETVAKLLAAGTNPNTQNQAQRTPLILALLDKTALYSRHINIMTLDDYENAKRIHQPWDDKKHKYFKGNVPLVIVSNDTPYEICKIIGTDGEEKNYQNDGGFFQSSYKNAAFSAFEELINDQYSRSSNRIRISENNPKLKWLFAPKPQGLGHVTYENNIKELVTLLLKHGADASVQDIKKRTALLYATQCDDDFNILETLLDILEKKVAQNELTRDELKKILNKQDNEGYNIVMYLMSTKNAKSYSRLLEKILNSCDGDFTILSTLSKHGFTALDLSNIYSKEMRSDTPGMQSYMDARQILNNKTPSHANKQKTNALKEAAHVMGFKSDPTRDAEMLDLNTLIGIKAEGFANEETFPLMMDVLNTFIDHEKKEEKQTPNLLQDFEKIRAAFAATTVLYSQNRASEENFLSPLFERFNKNEMTVIPAGWSGHSITLAFYQDKLIVSNRGEGKHVDGGVNIFNLNRKVCEEQYGFNSFITSIREGDFVKHHGIRWIATPISPAEFKPHCLEMTDALPDTEKDSYFDSKSGQPKKEKVPLFVLEGNEPNRKLSLYYRDFPPQTTNFPGKDGSLITGEKFGSYCYSAEAMNPDSFQKYLHFFKHPASDDPIANEIRSELAKRIYVSLATFPSKLQRHGTCAFVNKKSAIEAMLYLFHLERGNNHQEAMQYARQIYKYFTHQMRDQRVAKILNQLEQGLAQKEDSQIKLNLLLLEKTLSLQGTQQDQWDPSKNLQHARLARQLNVRDKIIEMYHKHPNNPLLKHFVEKQLPKFENLCETTYLALQSLCSKEHAEPQKKHNDMLTLLEREKALAPVMKRINECMQQLNNESMQEKNQVVKNKLMLIVKDMQNFTALSDRITHLQKEFMICPDKTSPKFFNASGSADWLNHHPALKSIQDAILELDSISVMESRETIHSKSTKQSV